MEIIRNKINHNLRLDDYLSINSCFMDIETTGFDRVKNRIYLVGLMYFKDGSYYLDQYLAQELDQERELIERTIKILNSFDNIISYNGQAFDLDFLNKRAQAYNLDLSIDTNSFDLYRLVKSKKDFLKLDSLKLKSLENYLNIERDDPYSGKDCIAFYKDFIVSKNLESKKKILKHNHDDLYYMLDLMTIIDHIEENQRLVSNKGSFTIDDYYIDGDSFFIQGRARLTHPYDLSYFSPSFDLNTKDLKSFLFRVNIYQGYISNQDQAYIIDLRDFNLKLSSNIVGYNIPKFIYPIKINRNYIMENIKPFLSKLINII